MQQTKLSIVVPVFNGKKYIADTLHSLEQLEKILPCECIFQNANSTDGTTEILDDFCRDNVNRHHYNEPDAGQSAAINTGAARARGRWVTWLCADDLLLPDIATALDEGDKAGADIVYGDVVFINGRKAFPAEGTEKYEPGVLAKRRLVIQQPGTCILREVWNAFGGVRECLGWTMDYDLFLRLESAQKVFLRSEFFLAVIRIHRDAKTSSGSLKRVVEMWSILRASHRRKPQYFRLRPYLVYGIEYLIKGMEARRSAGSRVPPRFILSLLHRFFWLIAVPRERTRIRQRFMELPPGTVELLSLSNRNP